MFVQCLFFISQIIFENFFLNVHIQALNDIDVFVCFTLILASLVTSYTVIAA